MTFKLLAGGFRRIGHRLGVILFTYPTDTFEFANSCLLFFWGLWMVNPFWDVYASAPVLYDAFMILPAWFWGTIALMIAVVNFATLFLDHMDRFRIVTSAIACAFWVTVVYGFVQGDPRSTATPMYAVPAFLSALTWLRLKLHRSYCLRKYRREGRKETPARFRMGNLPPWLSIHFDQKQRC